LEYEFDVIHAETFYIMPHIPDTKIPILLVEQTIEYRVYKHFIQSKPWFIHHPLRLDTFKLRYWERHFWRKATLVAAVSEADATAIKMLAPDVNPVVIPNGAGDEMFEHQALFARTDMNDLVKILFLGNFSWLQNKEAADILVKKIYPQLIRQIPHLQIVIAGQNIPDHYASLISDHISIVDLQHADTQTVKDLYAASHMFVAPIYGPGGTRLKILAAMATRIPIITTATGAEGLSLEDDVSYLQAQSIDDFVKQIVRLSQDSELQKRITETAYQLARKKYSWEAITRDLVSAYHQITNKSIHEGV
jgi:glycosyltransferase involved in cell wall biosynthesis